MSLQAIKYSDGKLQLLDQRLLPYEQVYLNVPDPTAAWQQIKVRSVSSVGKRPWLCRTLVSGLETVGNHVGHGRSRRACYRRLCRTGAGGPPDLWRQGQAVQQC